MEVWELADMYQIGGLKYYCMGALERGLKSKENARGMLIALEGLSCPCDELKRICNRYNK